MNSEYLPLTDYSTKHKVSISTLRRRIKTEEIRYKFEDGKYLILDEPVGTHQRVHRPSLQNSEVALVSAQCGAHGVIRESAPSFGFQPLKTEEGPIISEANRLLIELKRAYTQVLQEKEEQILQLKEEASDLKTLVRVLEAENERLSKAKR